MSFFRSEWIKLFTTRTTWVMLGVGLLGEALFAGLYTGLASLSEIGDLTEVASGIGLLLVLTLVLGVLTITTEFRHGTTGSTFLAAPRRWPVMAAKLAAGLVLGVLVGLLYVALNAGLSVPLFSGRGGDLPATGEMAKVYAGVVVSYALLIAFGLGVGAIVRNQVGAILAAIAFFFILSPLPELLPGAIGDFFPAQAIGSLQGSAEGDSSLGQVAGGLVLAAWSFGLCAIGTLLVVERDLSD